MGSVENTRPKMNQIILVVAFLGSAVLSEEVVRKPKLFFVSTSATTSTLQTLPSVTFPQQPLPPAQAGRGEQSPWMGWNQKEQFSRPPSRGRLKESPCKTRQA